MTQGLMIAAEVRQQRGTRAARKLRDSGKIPAIVYGHGETPVTVVVDEHQLFTLVRHGAHGLMELDIQGAKESVVIREIQWDVFGQKILHLDFARVSKDERVTVEVPIMLRGTAKGSKEGGVVDHQLHSIEIEGPASSIVENLTVRINDLALNQAILVKDLVLPEGIVVKEDADKIVVQVKPPAEEEEAEEGAEAATAEPELIRREGKKEEGEETEG